MNAVNKKKKYVEPACFSTAMTLHTNKNISTIPSTDFYGFFFFSVDLGKVFWRGEKKNQNKISLDFFRNCLHRRQSFPKYHNC